MSAAMSPAARRAIWWHAPWILGAAIQAINAVMQILAGDISHAATAAILGGLLALWPIYARYEFRRAWSSGYVEGVFTPAHLAKGTIPEPLLRQTITGYVAPDPWDEAAPSPRHTTNKGE